MFDEKEILTRLQNGESIEDIANEMSNLINKVNKTYTNQKAAEEAAAAKAEVQKKEDLQEILDMFTDWFNAYYDIETDGKLDAETVLELIDSVKEYIEVLKDLESMFDIKKPAAKATKSSTRAKSSDEKISEFLKKMGW